MSESVQSKNWSQTALQIKKNFSRFTDKNIESLDEKLENLPLKIESVYGYAKDKAQKEFENFKLTLDNRQQVSESKKKDHETPNNASVGRSFPQVLQKDSRTSSR